MSEKLELYKNITATGKKKLYESKKQFDQNWKKHKADRDRWVGFDPDWDVPSVVGYKLQLQHDGSFAWTQIKKSV